MLPTLLRRHRRTPVPATQEKNLRPPFHLALDLSEEPTHNPRTEGRCNQPSPLSRIPATARPDTPRPPRNLAPARRARPLKRANTRISPRPRTLSRAALPGRPSDKLKPGGRNHEAHASERGTHGTANEHKNQGQIPARPSIARITACLPSHRGRVCPATSRRGTPFLGGPARARPHAALNLSGRNPGALLPEVEPKARIPRGRGILV